MANKDTTTTLGIDISQFKRGFQDAQRQIKLANAEFKAASASMDKWSDSTDGVRAKIAQLEKTIDAENKKLELQKQRLIEVEREQGKNSAGAEELRIEIAKQQAEIAKSEKSLGYFNDKLSQMNKAENQAKTATGQLTGTINDQQSKLDALKKKYSDVVIAQGANSKEAKALGAQITALSGDLQTNKQKLADAENAADKLDKSLTEVGDAATEAGKDAENAGNGGFTVLKGVMANLATQAVNAALNGLKSMGSAIINVGKQAVAGYAEMEQLKGGIDKLFGESADDVINYANNAYKTAGLSANDYMETVTSFSASLISGLGGDTEKAAKIADVAITDMSDNANTFGTSIQDIQNAYQGFAKGNFTMLDNLKLGYGGTKEEMLRLVNESGVLEETVESIDDVSFDQIIMAINKTQERMGIAGATAAEAAKTIEGSANAMKAAWGNLVTGLADENADLDGLINNFIDSLLTYASNIMPVVQTAIGGITKLIVRLVQDLLPQVLDIIAAELPNFLNAGAQLLVTLITGIVSAIPDLTTALLSAISMIITTISEAIPDIVNAFLTAFPLFVTAILNAVPDLLNAFITLFTAIVDAIPQFIPYLENTLPQLIDLIVTTLNDNIPVVLDAAIMLLNAIVDAIPLIINALVPQLPKIINSIASVFTQNLPVVLNAAITLLNTIVEAIPVIINALVPQLPGIIETIVNALVTNLPLVLDAAIKLLMAIVNAIPKIIPALLGALPKIISAIIKTLMDNFPVILNAAIEFLMAIVDAIPVIIETLVPIIPDIVMTIIDVLIENIPVLLEGAFKMFMAIVEAIPLLIVKLIPALGKIITTITVSFFEPTVKLFSKIWDKITEIFGKVGSWFKEKFTDAWEKIKAVFDPVGKFFSGIWDTIKEKFTDIGQKVGDAIGGAFKKAINFVLQTAENVLNAPINAINNLLDVINDVPGINIGTLPTFDLPRLEQGGVLKRGQVGLLEGNGSEAVIPLDQNKKWINATAKAMNEALNNQGVTNNNRNVTNNYNFTQNNTSPKALSRLEIYRQTKNQFNFAAGVTGG